MATRRTTYPDDVIRDEGHDRITWSQFDVTGLIETQRSGLIWSVAPAIKGDRSFWVVPDDHDHDEPWVIAVTVISRRRQVGRASSDQSDYRSTVTGPIARYRSNGGRVIDQGEAISEAHPDSPTGQMTARGRSRLTWSRAIKMPAIPEYIYRTLSKPIP